MDKHFISSSKVSLIRLTQHSFSLFVGLLKILDNSGQMLGSSRAKELNENKFIRHVVKINTSVATLSLNNYFLLVMFLLYNNTVFRVLVGAVCREGGFQLSIVVKVMH